MFYKVIWFGLAGAFGSFLRLGLTRFIHVHITAEFPISTLVVNVVGCFFFGIIWSIDSNILIVSDELRFIILVGFLGAFTTFSTFSFEVGTLFQTAQWWVAVGYMLISNVAGVSAVMVGIVLGKNF